MDVIAKYVVECHNSTNIMCKDVCVCVCVCACMRISIFHSFIHSLECPCFHCSEMTLDLCRHPCVSQDLTVSCLVCVCPCEH